MKYFRIACSCFFFALGPSTVKAGPPPFDTQGVSSKYLTCDFETVGMEACDQEANLIAEGNYNSVDWQNWSWQIWYTDGSFVVGGWLFD